MKPIITGIIIILVLLAYPPEAFAADKEELTLEHKNEKRLELYKKNSGAHKHPMVLFSCRRLV